MGLLDNIPKFRSIKPPDLPETPPYSVGELYAAIEAILGSMGGEGIAPEAFPDGATLGHRALRQFGPIGVLPNIPSNYSDLTPPDDFYEILFGRRSPAPRRKILPKDVFLGPPWSDQIPQPWIM